MIDKARIALAEAMGFVRVESGAAHWHYPKGSAAEGNTVGLAGLRNPFKYANDDYAVLEWMRSNETWTSARTGIRLFSECQWHYQIGDYARAACKVLEIDCD